MGFKNIVATSTHEEVYEMMKKINGHRESNASIDWIEENPHLIKTTTYSDSIIIYSKDDSDESLYSIINTVSALTNDLFSDGIPHKGAIAHGTMTLDTKNSIFFGQPLIDAYLIQEDLGFYGIVVHGTAEKIVVKSPHKSQFIKNYLCPFKNGSSFHLTIYPMFADEKEGSPLRDKRDKIHSSLQEFRFTTSGSLRRYIDNTKAYLETIE